MGGNRVKRKAVDVGEILTRYDTLQGQFTVPNFHSQCVDQDKTMSNSDQMT